MLATVTISQQAQPPCVPNGITLFAGLKFKIDEKLMTPICLTDLCLDLKDKMNETRYKLDLLHAMFQLICKNFVYFVFPVVFHSFQPKHARVQFNNIAVCPPESNIDSPLAVWRRFPICVKTNTMV